jgi:C-terminal processing protease CtpA/Prc
MVVIISIGAIVYGIMKVFKMEKQIKGIREDAKWNYNDMNDRFKDYHQRIENSYTNSKDMAYAYTDMRIDKLEDKLTGASIAKEQLKNKNLIKG